MSTGGNEPIERLFACGRYRVLAQLGRGGMARVYLAVMRGPYGVNKLVVLKVPHESLASNAEMREMFQQEARLAALLNHPNIVHTYEVVQHEGRDITVMEYLEGQPLHKLVQRATRIGQPVPLGMHLHILSEALTGLHQAHEAKGIDGRPLQLVHRDISPANVFVTFDGAVKILDFGIAKSVASTTETAYGTFKGRIRYMSPEHLTGERVDRRTDIFAMGAMLWEAAVGEAMWQGRSDIEVMTAVLNDRVPSPRSVRADVPAPLDAIVTKAMAHHRADRYRNGLEFQAAIESFARSLPDSYTARHVAAKMVELFTPLREERQRLVDMELQRARGQSTGEYVALAAPDSSRPSFTMHSAARWPTTVQDVPTHGTSSGPTSVPTGAMHLATSVTSVRQRPFPVRTVQRAALVLIAAAVLSLVVLRASDRFAREPVRTNGGQSLTEEPAAPVSSAASAASAAPREVVVVIRTEPSDARLSLDGTPLPSNPWIYRGPANASLHEIHAEAKGYVARDVRVDLDKDRDIVFRLVKGAAVSASTPPHSSPVRASSHGGPSSVAVAPPAPAPTSVVLGSTPAPAGESGTKSGKSARPVDTSDPWAK